MMNKSIHLIEGTIHNNAQKLHKGISEGPLFFYTL